MEYLDTLYSVVAQYDNPPDYPLNVVCNGIDNGTQGTDILGRIFSGIVAYIGKKPCYDFNEFWSSESVDGWDWQVIKRRNSLSFSYQFTFIDANSS